MHAEFWWGKSKAIPVTGRGGPQGCEMSRIPNFQTFGEIVSLTGRSPFTTQEYFWYSFPLEAESTPGP
jgi:hypothetical protein